MKKDNCAGCNKEIEVFDDYEPQYCCSGFQCGCEGLPINPEFCSDCAEKLFSVDENVTVRYKT